MYCPSCGHQNLPGSDACAKCESSLSLLDLPAPHDRVESSLMTDQVAALKPRPPVTIPATADLGTAVRQMMDLGVGAVLVTDRDDQLVGILTERDFLTKIAGQPGFERLPVAQFMTRDPVSVANSDPLSFALSKMDTGGYRHMPVVEAGKPVGVISVRDVLRHVTRLCKDG